MCKNVKANSTQSEVKFALGKERERDIPKKKKTLVQPFSYLTYLHDQLE
jgi:hypothetical protein